MSVHIEFFRHVLHAGVTIITFNYDPVAELAVGHVAAELGITWHPLTGYGIELNELGAVGAGEHPLSDFRVLKLHGSVNWVVPVGSAPHPPFRLLRLVRESLRGQGWRVRRDEQDRAMRPVLVPPMPDKDYEAMGLSGLWRQAGAALHSATSLTVIGYRLPDTDAKARNLVESEARHPSASDRVTYVTDGDEDAIARFIALFPITTRPSLAAVARRGTAERLSRGVKS
jgi:hypothetical protein